MSRSSVVHIPRGKESLRITDKEVAVQTAGYRVHRWKVELHDRFTYARNLSYMAPIGMPLDRTTAIRNLLCLEKSDILPLCEMNVLAGGPVTDAGCDRYGNTKTKCTQHSCYYGMPDTQRSAICLCTPEHDGPCVFNLDLKACGTFPRHCTNEMRSTEACERR
jgi:hypothetical protein